MLNGQVRVTATFRRPDGRALHVRKTTQAEPEQERIYQALGVDPCPGGVPKMIVCAPTPKNGTFLVPLARFLQDNCLI